MLCKGNKILVALKKDQPDVTTWKPGQLVIGSDKWNCAHNVLKPESKTVYAKVAEIKRPKAYVIELHTTDAGYVLTISSCSIGKQIVWSQLDLR